VQIIGSRAQVVSVEVVERALAPREALTIHGDKAETGRGSGKSGEAEGFGMGKVSAVVSRRSGESESEI
jgi:hypothetical protein